MLKIDYKKLFALMLSLIMIVYCLPVHILALETEEINVVVEEKALREENVKHFKMPDGSYTAVVYEVSYTIENRDNGVYTLTVLASKEWIDDSERKFPVVIDPTITVDAGYKDTYINSADPDVNYGRSNELWISSSKTAFMKYNSLPSIPEYATINRAVLDLNYYYYVTSGSVDVGFYLAYIDWDEYSLTWNKANQNLWLGIIPMQFSTITLPASASITEDTPGLASINVTELVQAWYAGGANCGIALKYEGGSNGSVIIKSWEAGSSTRAKYEISYSTGGIPLSNGTYFFKNGQYDKYMQIDNNTSINENGAILELWEFDGGLDQKWTLEYMHNGYYKISSCASGKVITAPSNVDNSLTQKDYGLSDEQLWKITAIGGMYKFSPKSNSSYYMAAGSGILGSNGRNVEMRASQSDSKDKWALHMQNDYTLMYIGYKPGDTLMPPILNTVKTALTNANKTGYGYTSLNKADLLAHLSSTSIFSCITHGLSTAIATTDDTLTVNNINALDNTAFDSLKFVYLGACLTGEGGSSANNLVNAFYNKGADTVLGFTISVLVGETNSWTKSFMLSLASGSTISKAMTDADTAVRNDATVNVVHYTTSSTYRYIAGSPQIAPCK